MSGPHVSLDPTAGDMLDSTWTRIERQIEAEEIAFRAGRELGRLERRTRLVAVAMAMLSLGVLVGVMAEAAGARAHTAPRPAQTTTPLPSAAELGDRQAPVVLPPTAADAPRVQASTSAGPTPGPITEPDAVAAAIATWCAPTPTHCHGWGGDAHFAAVPSFRYGDRPYRLTVCLPDRARCTVVEVVSFCACGSADIDLSPAAFRDLAATSVGRIRVTISDARPGPATTPPPTDTFDG